MSIVLQISLTYFQNSLIHFLNHIQMRNIILVPKWCNLTFRILKLKNTSGPRGSQNSALMRMAIMTIAIFFTVAIQAQTPELMYYQFEDGGSSVSNVATSATAVGTNPAPILGALTTTGPGQFGQGLTGAGGSGSSDYVNTGWATNLSGDWTMSFYLANWNGTDFHYLLGDNTASSFRIFAAGGAGTNNITLRGPVSNVNITGVSNGAYTIHIVYDSSVPEIRAYVNGVLNTTVSQSSLNITGSGPFKIGAYSTSAGLPSGVVMDEFRLYNRALGATEIQNTYNANLNVSGNCANSFTNFVIDSISGTGAKVSWTPGSGNSSFFLEYGLSGFIPGGGTKITGTYPGPQPPVVLSGLTASTDYDIYFGEICNSGTDSVYFSSPQFLSTTKLCSPVLNFSSTGTTFNSTDLAWTHASAATDFDIIYGAPGFDPATGGTVVNTSGSPYTLGSLAAFTEYEIYISADCSTNGLSDTTGPISVKTLCGPYTAPYFNDFENDALDVPPGCWAAYATGTNAWVEVEDQTGTSAPYSGSQALYLFSGSSSTTPGADTLIAISPQFTDMPVGDKQIRFRANSDDPLDQLIIGTIPSLSPSATFTPIDTITFPTPDTYQEVILPLTTANGYNGTDEYIVLMHNLGVASDYIRIDNFSYEVIPACPKVSNISLTSIGVTSAGFSFTGSGTSYDVEFGPTGFTQGTGCVGSFSSTSITIDNSTDPGCSNQLLGNTTYDIYIRNNCSSSSNGLSIWEGPFTFTTLCAAYTAPYYNDFENDALDVPPTCWTEYETESSSFVEVEDFTGTAAPYSGSQALYLYSGSASTTPGTDTLFAYTPRFSDLPVGDKRVRFWANSDAPADHLIVGTASSLDPTTFNPIDTITFATADTYQRVVVDFTVTNGYNGTDEYIVLAHDLGVTTDYIRIDEFNYEVIPACQPSYFTDLGTGAIEGTTAELVWGISQGAKTYVEVGLAGFTPGNGTHVVLDSVAGSVDTYTATGLSGQTLYDFYVQDSCLPGGLSGWVGPFTFVTGCSLSPITLPFNDGFESYSGTISSDTAFYCGNGFGWSLERPGGTGDVVFGYTATGGPTPPYAGTQSAGLQSMSSSNVVYLILTVDLSAYASTASGIDLSFYWADHADEVSAGDRVWARGSKTDPWIEILNWSTVNSSNWEYFNTGLKTTLAANGQVVSSTTQIRWGQQDNAALSGDDGFGLDDVSLTVVTCPDPSQLDVSALVDTGAALVWSSSSSSINHEVWFGPIGFYQGTLTTGGYRTFNTTDSLYIDTLSEQSCYEYAVRSICGPGDTSAWVGPFSFCTECTNQLNGTYTIGSSTGADYADFASALVELNTCGIDGPTIFNVETGTYNEQVLLDAVPGVSATNTLVFQPDPGNTGPVEVTYAGTAAADNYVLKLNNMSYTTVRGITWSATGANFAKVVDMTGGGEFIIVEDNILNGKPAANSSSHNFDIISNNTTAANVYNNCTFFRNELNGGSFAIYLYGVDVNTREYNNVIDSNIVNGNTWSGISVNYQDSVKVRGNYINTGNTNATTYGIYSLNNTSALITGNQVYAKGTSTSYGLWSEDAVGTASKPTLIANNMVGALDNTGTATGLYVFDNSYTDVYHNSVLVNSGSSTAGRALYLNLTSSTTGDNVKVVNNSFINTGGGLAVEITTNASTGYINQMDYNNLYSSGTGLGVFAGTNIADLAAWITGSSLDANSVSGDPVYVNSEDLHALGNANNNVGTPIAEVPTDIENEVRSSTAPDIGADEFVPLAGDLAVVGGDFIKGLCLSSNDSAQILVQNIIGSTVNFATDSLVVNYDVTGPINTSGIKVIKTGTLPLLDTITVYIENIDLSLPGTYVLNAYIDSNAVNTLAVNDTLTPEAEVEVKENLTVDPASATLYTATDSVEICAKSAFFGGGGGFSISEICHYYNGGSNPGIKPSYLTSDDYIEVVGVPGSDMEGITLEIYRGAGGALLKSYTFPAGTVIGPNGTAIIMTGQTGKASEPSNFLYDGRGGNTTTMGSGDAAGYILREGSTIVDAVTYGAYTFDASTGVTAADWSGQVASPSGTAGMRLIVDDNNTAANWAVVTAAAPQDAQVLNAGVSLPAPVATTGFTWSLNGVQIDTASCTYAGPHTVGGTYNYVATYTNSCGTFTDTVVITVPNCFTPKDFRGGSTSNSSVYVAWDTTSLGAATYEVEYGVIGFTLGTGTGVTLGAVDSTEITGIPTNMCYEYYIRTVCNSTNQSPWIGPIRVCPEAEPCDQLDQYATGLINNGESALFLGWYGDGGDGAISSTRSQSASNSLHITDGGTNGASDVVAYFDTINTGAWSIDFSLYVESGSGAYYNIQQNHDTTGTDNQWAGDVYFDDLGTAHVEIDASNTIAGTFTYAQGQWFDISTIIDLTNDTVWVEYNGSSTGIGWAYSNYNPGEDLQFNGINFYSGVLSGQTYDIDYYMDDFCVSPYVPAQCPAPSAVTILNEGCDSVEVSWNSTSGNQSSIIEYGPAGFTPGTGAGTFISFVNSPQVVSGLTPGNNYDFYVADTCGSMDTSVFAGPISATTPTGPLPVASFTYTVSGFNVNFDGSASTGGTTYDWDFGDGNNGSGVITSHTYATGGTQTVTLTVSNSCGTDDTTITISGIDLYENALGQSLQIFPNPSNGVVTIEFEAFDSDEVVIRLRDVSGKQVFAKADENVNGKVSYELDLTHLADGVYMIEVSSGSLKTNRRLIKR